MSDSVLIAIVFSGAALIVGILGYFFWLQMKKRQLSVEVQKVHADTAGNILEATDTFQKELLHNIEMLWDEHRKLREEVSALTKELTVKTREYSELKVKYDKLQIDYNHLKAEHAESTRRENKLIDTVSELQLKIITLQKQSMPR